MRQPITYFDERGDGLPYAEQIAPAWPSLIEAPINIDKTGKDADAPDDEYVYWPN